MGDTLHDFCRALRNGTKQERDLARHMLEINRRALAFHEAGHAVMLWRVSVEIGGGMRPPARASILSPAAFFDWAKMPEADPGIMQGYVLGRHAHQERRFFREPHSRSIPGFYDRAVTLDTMVCLAGPVAEDRLVVSCGRRHWSATEIIAFHQKGRDIKDAKRFLAFASEPVPLEILVCNTYDFIEREDVWRTVTAVADALIKYNTLSGDKLLRIMRETWMVPRWRSIYHFAKKLAEDGPLMPQWRMIYRFAKGLYRDS